MKTVLENLSRRQKAMLSSTMSLVNQIVTVICGFILPRFFLQYYGSSVNGLVSSITQFLGFISLAELGVGAVVRSSFYLPLANKDDDQISRIYLSSERFFRKLALLLLVYVIVLMVVYPIITINSFDYLYSASLILIISLSMFAQFYVGMSYRLLISADQLSFIILTLQCLSILLKTIFSIILIKMSFSIHTVKLVSSIILMIQPITLAIFAKYRYKLNRKIKLEGEPIKQKWNGLAQHIATVVLHNTDIAVLTLFSTLQNVSVYAVYFMVVNGLKNLVDSFTNGWGALMGDQYAKGEIGLLNNTFGKLEWIIHYFTVLVYSIAGLTIVEFVNVYTKGITDAVYYQPVFAILMILAHAAYCMRLPYSLLVLSAGHFKQTQNSAIIEAVINIIISVVTVMNWGLVGVAVGTLAAMVYRTVYYVWYLSKDILVRDLKPFLKIVVVDTICVASVICIKCFFPSLFKMSGNDYMSWFVFAVKSGTISFSIVTLINLSFYSKHINWFLTRVKLIKKN